MRAPSCKSATQTRCFDIHFLLHSVRLLDQLIFFYVYCVLNAGICYSVICAFGDVACSCAEMLFIRIVSVVGTPSVR